MTPRRITQAQIAAHVRALADRSGGNIIALRGAPEWDGPDVMEVDTRSVRITPCPSVLAVRQALVEAADWSGTLVVLTDRSEPDLGDDVVGRLARQRVIVPNIWDMLANLFGATTIDPRLSAHPWLAEALLELVSGNDRPVVPGRVLGLELALDTLLERLGLPAPASVEGLLGWSAEPARLHGYRGAAESVQVGIERLLVEAHGQVAGHVLRMVRGDKDAQVVPVGLVARVLFPAIPTAESGKALGGLEQGYLSGTALAPAAALEWAAGSEAVVRRLLGEGSPAAEMVLDRAEELLTTLGASGLAGASNVLRSGLERRLEAFAAALDDGGAREGALASVEQHLLATHTARRRVEAARMASRLMRWSRTNVFAGEPGFADACAWYQDEGGWLDRARASLWLQDSNPEVAARYEVLTAEMDGLRGEMNLAFARVLQSWLATYSQDDRVIPIETVLERVVAPLAATTPVLMLVMDGMSMAAFRELSADLTSEGFRELTPVGVPRRRPAVSVAPSVTEACRASLVSGTLTVGNQGREQRRFAAHPALVSVSKAGAPPRMLHKADLVQEDGRSLAPSAEHLVLRPEQRVVGAVLNVIDDQLMKGDQLALEFTAGTIPLLRRLLAAARQAGRVVVFASDHGHVFERGLEYRKLSGDGGERWRAGADPAEDEVLLRGERVLLGDGQVIAAATERVRYAPKRNGYHGGATPQEMVVPLSVWAPTLQNVPGWEELVDAPPAWWTAPPLTAPLPAVQPPPASKVRQPAGQASLFEQPDAPAAPEPTGGSWVDRLIACTTYADQTKLAGRFRLDEAMLRSLLTVLDARGGRAPLDVVAQAAGVPTVRASGLVTQAQRVLNVDGYPVISVDSATDDVVLNRDQLLAQFGL